MDPGRALPCPLQRGIDRIAVAGLGARFALREADGLTVCDVDRGEEDQLGRGREIVHGLTHLGREAARGGTRVRGTHEVRA